MTGVDVTDLLACAALEPALGGLLFLDLDGRTLHEYAAALATTMGTLTGAAPEVVQVDSATTDEDLWPHWGVTTAGRMMFRRLPGWLSEAPDQSAPVIVIPDLARVGTAVLRAAVSVVGADVVHVERHDIGEYWQPTGRWLAACSRRDILALSPHLLDRFPVRWARPRPAALVAPAVDRAALDARPAFPPQVLDLVTRAVPGQGNMRRCLALARAARGFARRRHASVVDATDLTRASEMLGLRPDALAAIEGDSEPSEDPPATPDRHSGPKALSAVPATPTTPEELAERPANAETRPERRADLDLAGSLYPEDDPEAVPQPFRLRWRAAGPAGAGRTTGTVTGHDPADSLRDLAIVPTLLRALRRNRLGGEPGRLQLMRGDLRQNRRASESRQLLILLLDHTSRREWDCSPGLAEHLRWAYDQAAAVSVIELGHHGAAHELRPERFRVRSVVDPHIMAAFDRAPGRATPLAAGIEMAARELQRSMHRGSAFVDMARLVVVTDGRGNVPLDASRRGRVIGPISREGVDDAVAVAASVARIRRVTSQVVAPALQQYQALPEQLAKALDADITVVQDPRDLP